MGRRQRTCKQSRTYVFLFDFVASVGSECDNYVFKVSCDREKHPAQCVNKTDRLSSCRAAVRRGYDQMMTEDSTPFDIFIRFLYPSVKPLPAKQYYPPH